MAKVNGYNCDVCGKFGHGVTAAEANNGDVATVDGTPAGWMRLILPYTHGRSDEAKRDVCSGKCLVKFGKDRAASVPQDGKRTDGMASRSRAGGYQSTTNPALKAWLAERGVEGKLIGGAVGAHTRFHTDGQTRDGCLVCEWEANQADAPEPQAEGEGGDDGRDQQA